MSNEFTIDSNILIYAFDPTDALKHRISSDLVKAMFRRRAFLPMQCLCEFYSVTTRKRLLSLMRAREIVVDCQRSLSVFAAEPPELTTAISIQVETGLQFFDCMLIATVARARGATLITEDMQDGRTIRGVEILNPFTVSAAELDRVLA